MKFKYKKFPADSIPSHPDRKNIIRPVIPIYLRNGDKRIGYEVLIDSGADYCIFHSEIGELLDIEIRSGPKTDFFGIGGVKQEAFFHYVDTEVGGEPYKCYAGFSYEIDRLPYGIMGQDNFFNIFVVIFDKKKECLILKNRHDKK